MLFTGEPEVDELSADSIAAMNAINRPFRALGFLHFQLSLSVPICDSANLNLGLTRRSDRRFLFRRGDRRQRENLRARTSLRH